MSFLILTTNLQEKNYYYSFINKKTEFLTGWTFVSGLIATQCQRRGTLFTWAKGIRMGFKAGVGS